MKTIAAMVLLAGCAPAKPARPAARAVQVQGAPADVTIAEGAYPGYEVFRACKLVSIAVVGTGARPFPWIAKGFDASGNYDRELQRAFRGAALGAAHARSIHASGFGAPCRTKQAAFAIFLSDYRDVDELVQSEGAFLQREDYAGEIDVIVMPVPTAQ